MKDKKSKYFTCLPLVCALVFLSGCAVLPSDGPSPRAIKAASRVPLPEETPALLSYDLKKITADMPASGKAHKTTGFSKKLRGPRVIPNRIAAGDTIQMTLWENAEVGLLAATGERATQVVLTVDENGSVNVPYIGGIRAEGQTLSALRERLITRYRQQTLDPEITLSLLKSTSRLATILGDVRNDGRIEVPLEGLSLVEMVAQAGGTGAPTWEVQVQLMRSGQRETVLLSDVFHFPKNNVSILPGDIVHIVHNPRRYIVMGAVRRPGATEVDTEEVSILDLLSAAGGLETTRAAPGAVFIYRNERGTQPVVFMLDLSQPDSLFLGETFQVRADDVMYAGTADAITLNRFLSLIFSPLSSVASSSALSP